MIIDVELLEVDRTKLREYGLQLATPGSPGLDGSLTVNETNLTARSVRNLSAEKRKAGWVVCGRIDLTTRDHFGMHLKEFL